MVPSVPAPAANQARTNTLEQDMSAMVNYVAMELTKKRPPKLLVKELTLRGVSQANAEKIVSETERMLGKARGEKYRKRMFRGLLWTIAGIIITCGTYLFAEDLGGQYVLCYGAIIFGVIDFLAGLIGWIFSR